MEIELISRLCILTLAFLMWKPLPVSGQEKSDSIALNELVESLDYNEVETVWRPKEYSTENPFSSIFSTLFSSIFSVLGYSLLIILIVAILLYVVKNAQEKTKKEEKEKEVNLDEIDNIEEVDFDELMNNALQNGDYRLAVRIHFLKCIQLLSKKELLLWKPFKTNRAFISELKQGEIKDAFQRLAEVFEYTWYGIQIVDQNTYAYIKSDFVKFEKAIHNED